MHNSNLNYIVRNIIDKQTDSKHCLPNQKISLIYKVGEVNIGVIGLTHIKIANESVKANSLMFLPYRDIIITESKYLHDKGVNAVVPVSAFWTEMFRDKRHIFRTSMNSNNDHLKEQCENF